MIDVFLSVILGAAFLAAYVGIVVWTIGDAQKRGQTGFVFLILFWCFGPVAALIWLLIRPKTTVLQRSPESYSNADDALAAASRLDQLGEWDAALVLYENAAHRWPEHKEYVGECVRRINDKKALA